MPVPLSPRPIVIMSDGAMLVSNGNDSVVRVLDLDGLAASEWVLPVPVPTVTSDEFRIAIAERLQAIPANRQVMMRSLYEAMTPPEHRAPLATLLIDRHGLVWAALATDDLSHGQTWLVIGQGGDVRARVRMPLGVDVLEVGDDYVLVRWRDALDVEFVRVHTLARTAA